MYNKFERNNLTFDIYLLLRIKSMENEHVHFINNINNITVCQIKLNI